MSNNGTRTVADDSPSFRENVGQAEASPQSSPPPGAHSARPTAAAESAPPSTNEYLAGILRVASEPPSDLPRSEWTSASFGYPGWHTPVVGLDSVNWAAKKASLATRAALDSGDWSAIDPVVTLPLVVCDKVLQLYVIRHLAPPGT